jgi:hypothetical protein
MLVWLDGLCSVVGGAGVVHLGPVNAGTKIMNSPDDPSTDKPSRCSGPFTRTINTLHVPSSSEVTPFLTVNLLEILFWLDL